MSKTTVVPCFKCNACGKIHSDEKTAVKCCAQRYCEDCGIEVKKYRICCEPCGLNRQFEKAEKLQPEQGDGWVHSDEVGGYNEGYFSSLGALIDHCEDEGIPVPKWVFCCKPIEHKLDVEHALESMLEEAYEDAYDDLVDVDELQKFVDEWNAKQTVTTYYPDEKRVVFTKVSGPNE